MSKSYFLLAYPDTGRSSIITSKYNSPGYGGTSSWMIFGSLYSALHFRKEYMEYHDIKDKDIIVCEMFTDTKSLIRENKLNQILDERI